MSTALRPAHRLSTALDTMPTKSHAAGVSVRHPLSVPDGTHVEGIGLRYPLSPLGKKHVSRVDVHHPLRSPESEHVKAVLARTLCRPQHPSPSTTESGIEKTETVQDLGSSTEIQDSDPKTESPLPPARFFLKGCHYLLMSSVKAPDFVLSGQIPRKNRWCHVLVSHLTQRPTFRSYAQKALGLPSSQSSFQVDIRILHRGGDIEIRQTPPEVREQDLHSKSFLPRLFSENAPYVNGPNLDWVRFNEANNDTLTLEERIDKLTISKIIDLCLRTLFFQQHKDDPDFHFYYRLGGHGWFKGYQYFPPQAAQENFRKGIEKLTSSAATDMTRLPHKNPSPAQVSLQATKEHLPSHDPGFFSASWLHFSFFEEAFIQMKTIFQTLLK